MVDGGRRRQSHVVESRTGLLNLLGKFASNLIYGNQIDAKFAARWDRRGIGGIRVHAARDTALSRCSLPPSRQPCARLPIILWLGDHVPAGLAHPSILSIPPYCGLRLHLSSANINLRLRRFDAPTVPSQLSHSQAVTPPLPLAKAKKDNSPGEAFLAYGALPPCA